MSPDPAHRPSRDQHLVRFYMEVQASSDSLRDSAGREYGGYLGFIWSFVGTEPDIAVNAKQGVFGIHNKFRGALLDGRPKRRHQLCHRSFDLPFIYVLVGSKPFPVVVPLELPQESERIGRKSSKSVHHMHSPLNLRYSARVGIAAYSHRASREIPLSRVVKASAWQVKTASNGPTLNRFPSRSGTRESS
jgi:hypothetical protein